MQFKQVAIIDYVNITKEAFEKVSSLSESETIIYDSDPRGQEEVKERISDADCILVGWRTKITEEVLDSCKNLKFICLSGTNSDNIDLEACRKRGIVVSNIIAYFDEGVGEWIFSQLLILARGLGKYKWGKGHVELSGKTLGIIGLGAIGKLLADIALGFHMNVLYNSKTRKPEWEKKGLLFVEKEELLKRSDIISLQTPKNVKIISKEDFKIMKGKILVNNTLGRAFNEGDFKEWIQKEGNFAIVDKSGIADFKGALDNINKVMYSDFIAGTTQESTVRLGQKIEENMKAYLLGEPINHLTK